MPLPFTKIHFYIFYRLLQDFCGIVFFNTALQYLSQMVF